MMCKLAVAVAVPACCGSFEFMDGLDGQPSVHPSHTQVQVCVFSLTPGLESGAERDAIKPLPGNAHGETCPVDGHACKQACVWILARARFQLHTPATLFPGLKTPTLKP